MNSDQYETCLVVAKRCTYTVACVNMARKIMKNNTAEMVNNTAGIAYKSIQDLAYSGMENTWDTWTSKLKGKIDPDKLKGLYGNVTLTTQSISSASIVIANYIDKELKDEGYQIKENDGIRERSESKIDLYGVVSLSVLRDTKDCVCCSTPNQDLEDECNTLSSLLDKLNYLNSWKCDACHPKCCGTCCGIQCFNRMVCCCNTSCCCITKEDLLEDIRNIITSKLECKPLYSVKSDVNGYSFSGKDTVTHNNPDGYNRSTTGLHSNFGLHSNLVGHNGSLQSPNIM